MKTVVIVRPDVPAGAPQPTFWHPVSEAFAQCFKARGWTVKSTTQRIHTPPDLVAGYGWKQVMHEAHDHWPERVLHADLGFWTRTTYLKLGLGDRWAPLADHEYDGARFEEHGISILPTRKPGKRVLVCGMSVKAAVSWGFEPQQWERKIVRQLVETGANVVYRPKPPGQFMAPLPNSEYNQSGTLTEVMRQRVDAVVSHHSNAAIDALAEGLPIYVKRGISRSLSVPNVEDVIGAEAPSIEARTAFLHQVAYHQWTLKELAEGTWLEPPAPLSGHLVLCPN